MTCLADLLHYVLTRARHHARQRPGLAWHWSFAVLAAVSLSCWRILFWLGGWR